ncbi:MAG: hypothetical protein JW947_03705 [Sedimentisphaerales bacterium]|nr:hypothetical protein [Sedimentisphaerales bacterium]
MRDISVAAILLITAVPITEIPEPTTVCLLRLGASSLIHRKKITEQVIIPEGLK